MLLGLADRCRPTSRSAIRGLQELGIECVMLTGDNEGAAESVRYQTGLTHVQFGMKPEEKKQWITNRQVRGFIVVISVPLYCSDKTLVDTPECSEQIHPKQTP